MRRPPSHLKSAFGLVVGTLLCIATFGKELSPLIWLRVVMEVAIAVTLGVYVARVALEGWFAQYDAPYGGHASLKAPRRSAEKATT